MLTEKINPQRFGKLSIGLHWLMLILLIAVYACIELRELYPKGSDPREAFKAWHFMLGLSVFMLAMVRLAVRLLRPVPSIKPEPSQAQKTIAAIMHAMLYVLMIGAPLLGWLYLSAAGKPIPFFGFDMPSLLGENKELAGSIKSVHQQFGTVGYVLIGVHAAAALFHHYVVRDNTLLRMLPVRTTT